MKKSYTKLLIITIVCAIAILVLCILAIKYNNTYQPFAATEQVINEVKEAGSDTPGAGEYLLIAGGTSLAVDFATVLAITIFTIAIPGFLMFIILISQLIARLVQIGEEKKGKNTTSKVFTIISIVLQIILCTYQLFIIICEFEINKILLSLTLILNITSVVLYIIELKKIKKINAEMKVEVIEEKI